MIIDILVLLILALSALIAFMRGFIREVLTIVGVVGGMIAAYYGGPVLLPLMDGWLGIDHEAETPQKLFDIIPYTYVSIMLSYGAVFIIVVVILSIISHMIAETVKSLGLGAVDRTLGVVFGVVRGILLLGILYLPVLLMIDEETTDKWFEESRSHFYIEQVAEELSGLLPEEAKRSLEQQSEESAETMDPETRATLERLDLLKKSDEAPVTPPEKGYQEKQRNEMDKLFENFNRSEGSEGQ